MFCATVNVELIQSLHPLLVLAEGAGAASVLGEGKECGGVWCEGFL